MFRLIEGSVVRSSDNVVSRISQSGIIAVVVIEHPRDGLPVASALSAGGVDIVEITYRTPSAGEVLAAIRREFPHLLVGAGTLLSEDAVRSAVDAGASFGVSPGFSVKILDAAHHLGLPLIPGTATASDVQVAIEHGCKTLKFFPARSLGGPPALEAVAAPFLHLGVEFVPAGGIRATDCESYWQTKGVVAVGGTWLAPRSMITKSGWPSIEANAAEVVRLRAAWAESVKASDAS